MRPTSRRSMNDSAALPRSDRCGAACAAVSSPSERHMGAGAPTTRRWSCAARRYDRPASCVPSRSERGIRAVLIGLAAWAVWKFRSAQGSLQAALDRDLPLLRASGIKVDQITAISELEKALAAKPSTLTLLTVVLLAYAVLELVEAVGLWLLKRWGEYFAVVATAVFVPLEVYDLTRGLTLARADLHYQHRCRGLSSGLQTPVWSARWPPSLRRRTARRAAPRGRASRDDVLSGPRSSLRCAQLHRPGRIHRPDPTGA